MVKDGECEAPFYTSASLFEEYRGLRDEVESRFEVQ